MIPAAGLGSRLGHGLPKCMLEIDGKTILTRLVETLREHTDRIHVVVGYREELIIEHCATYHRDVVLVRNTDFRNTNTITSLALGARGLDGKLLFVDGDTILEPGSLAGFLETGENHDVLLGIAPAKSEDTVYVSVDHDRGVVTGFSRETTSDYEWANLLLAPSAAIAGSTGYVYEALEPQLPLAAASVDLAEVDTEQDLRHAKSAIAAWESSSVPGA